LSEFPDRDWKLGSIEENPHSAGSDDNIEKVENFVFSQEDKPKRTYQLVRFRMKLAFLTHRIIHRHLQLKRFKRR